ncbi:MAG: hypothetical protein FWG49_06775 [Leptospirales bacterium]|nr:hypothetical protein [Leptospirales bacterium]
MADNLLKFFRLVLLVLLMEVPLLADGFADANFQLEDGVLSRIDSCKKSIIYDKVAAIHKNGDTLYYLRSGSEGWIAGFLKDNSDRAVEFNITGDYKVISKLYGEDNIFYFLARQTDETPPHNKNDAGGLFVRYNPDQNSFNAIEGAVDFHILEGKPLILKNGSLNYNGSDIPIMLRGRIEISEVVNSRIVIVKGVFDVEIVDLIAGKSIYQFNKDAMADYNDKYNLILEFEDRNVKTGGEQSIYYEIIIDGIEESRTETGRGDLSKLFYKKLPPGKYHIVKAERWKLDKEKGRYVRINNIYQPEEVKIFIPDNRIIKLRVEFNGKSYSINQSVVYR